MHLQVLVDPQRVERLGVEAGEEHVDDDEHIEALRRGQRLAVHVLALHAARDVLVVAVEALRVGGKRGLEHGVVVGDGPVKELAVGLRHLGGVDVLVVDEAVRVVVGPVGREAEDGRDLEVAALALPDHLPQDAVVALGALDGVAREDRVEAAAHAPADGVGRAVALGLLVEMVEDVGRHVVHAHGVLPSGVGVDGLHLHVLAGVAAPEGRDVVDLEGKDVAVRDRADDRVGVQAVAERLRGRAQVGVGACAGVLGEDGRAGEAEQVVVPERLGDGGVHLAELRAVALVEDEDGVPVEHLAREVRVLEVARELLDGGHADAPVGGVGGEVGGERAGVPGAVDGALLELVVLLHRLVVEVLAVDHEQHLLDALHLGRQLGSLEAGERLARAGRVPDVAAGSKRAQARTVVLGDEDAVEDALAGADLVRPHHEQRVGDVQHAVVREHHEQRSLGQERCGERHQVGDAAV